MADNRKLTPEDKAFLKLVENGTRPSPAFREAYPTHAAVIKWTTSEPGSPDHQKASELVKQAAKYKLQAKYMQKALVTYQDSMEKFSQLSLETATDLVVNARSEKVRADLAIEGIRHKIGTPVTKVAVQEKKVVYLTFDKPPAEAGFPEGSLEDQIIQSEVIDVLD